jgi:hypothetical protein
MEVRVDPQPINAGDIVKVTYSGLLAKSGAAEIYLHAGVAKQHQWSNTSDSKMENRSGIWTVNLQVQEGETFDFCFKDSANNWDNNNGYNWSYNIF